MNATIKDVAKAAGVSVATVSRVLNNSAVVSDQATESVTKAIKELGYSPNFLGRNLRKCNTNTILAIIPSTEQTFYSEIIRGMQTAAFNNGYTVLFSTSNFNKNIEQSMLNMLYNRTVDGAILFRSSLDLDTLQTLNKNYHIALCCERIENSGVLTVSVDDIKGAFDATQFIINKGHKKIAMISTETRTQSSIDREEGYRLALVQNGINYNENYIFKENYLYKSGCDALDYFMELDERPTAIFCVSDMLAAGAIKEATRKGYNVPCDISICGYDDIQLSEIMTPGITTIKQPCFEMGSTVIEKLVKCLQENIHTDEHVKLKHTLIIRDSVCSIADT